MLVTTVMVAAAPAPVAAAGEKVAIIVGPTGSLTNSFRNWANDVADTATAAGATVVKVYSPSATWANVRAAVANANIIVYFGHGNGYPNPYGSTQLYDRSNGWGLNRTTTNGDSDLWSSTLAYCGEKVLMGTLTSSDGTIQNTYCGGNSGTDGISPAPGFTMVYAQAHYAPGFGERYSTSDPNTTLSQAQQRVRNYSRPILRLGGTFLATAYGDADEIVGRVLAGGDTYGQIFADGRGYSPSTLTTMAHPDVSGDQVWVQRTTISSLHFGEPDYWYAFAGNPSDRPVGGSYDGPPIDRFGGADRYATAAAISRASFDRDVPVVYVATGLDFPDALAAGAAAAVEGGPVLLVRRTSVPPATATELAWLRPDVIKVVGGPGVISDEVAAALASYATTGQVERLAGANRYATAAAVSFDTFAPGVPVAYIATGTNFPDALAGVPAAGSEGGPVLLVRPTEIPSEIATELGRLNPGRIVVLGGPSVVSDGVVAALAAFASTGDVERLSGANRYATAVAISEAKFASPLTVYIATGQTFPDALGGGPVAGRLPGPLLLVSSTSVPSIVAAELQSLDPDRVVILGGPGAVSDNVTYQLMSILGD